MLKLNQLCFALALGLLLTSTPVLAQQDVPPPDDGGDEPADLGSPVVDTEVPADTFDPDPNDPNDPSQSGLLSDEQVLAENELGVDEGRASTDPYEDPSQTYMFLGAFYRHNWTPGFMLGLFLDEYTAANNPAFGLEFTYRKDNFDIITSVYYQGYKVNGPFLGSGDADTETEIIDSELFGVMASVDLMWGTQFNDYIGIQYGLGLGIGVLLGDLFRTEAYRNSSAEPWQACTGNGVPSTAYCDDVDGDGDLVGYTGVAAKWFSGGSVPNLYFRFAVPHLAIRIKPIHQVLIRIDGGFDLFSGFFTGISANYGF